MSTATIFDRLDDPTDHLYGLDDPERMRVLASIDVESPDLRRRLDAIATRTAERLDVPIAMVTLVLDTAQVFAGSHGIDPLLAATGIPVEWAMCAHAVATRRPYLVEDAATDPVQATNPAVVINGIGSYAGIPLILDGQALGGHCIITGGPRTFTARDLDELHATADEIIVVLKQYHLD